MSEQSLKDVQTDTPASHFQNLPMESTGKGCYTVNGAKMAGPEQEGGAKCNVVDRMETKAAIPPPNIMELARRIGMRRNAKQVTECLPKLVKKYRKKGTNCV